MILKQTTISFLNSDQLGSDVGSSLDIVSDRTFPTGVLERIRDSFGTVIILEQTRSNVLELTSEVAVVILVPPAAPTTRTARPSLSVTMLGHIEDSGRFPPYNN